ncbi:flavin reductase family protein [Dactylosporangium siamense]|uniref:flavin reductase family protein n=1 Tax=Dactylosporangium siamense TaxID=685454 RepID=UPI0031ED8E5E
MIGVVPDRAAPDAAAVLRIEQFKRVMGRYPTGVVVLATTVDGEPHGMAVNSFTSLSLDPMLVLFCVDRASTTWPHVRRAGRFAVSVLGAGQQEVCRTFARRGADRFNGVGWSANHSGQPVLHEAVAWLDCVTTAIHPGGDHLIVVAEVLRAEDRDGGAPLVFHRGRLSALTEAA